MTFRLYEPPNARLPVTATALAEMDTPNDPLPAKPITDTVNGSSGVEKLNAKVIWLAAVGSATKGMVRFASRLMLASSKTPILIDGKSTPQSIVHSVSVTVISGG